MGYFDRLISAERFSVSFNFGGAMARSRFSIPYAKTAKNTFDKWCLDNGYREIAFENGIWVKTIEFDYDTSLDPIHVSLREHSGFQTFVKPSFGNSLLVMEVRWDDEFHCECYAPLLIFGVFRKELAFKPKSGFYTQYLSAGYDDMQDLVSTLSREDPFHTTE